MKLTNDEAWVLRRFLELYYQGPKGGLRPFEQARWMGVTALKCPLDLWIYQELLFERRPGLIVETGTRFGGTTLYLAHLCDLLGHGHVVSIDVEDLPRPEHPRVTYLRGSSTDPAVFGRVAEMRPSDGPVLVILDSDHRKEHVEQELELYATLIGPGDYIVVEDTNINGHPVLPNYGPGPHEAAEAFLDRHRQFRRDRSREKFLLTFNPGGYLQHADAATGAVLGSVDSQFDGVADGDPYELDLEHGETPLDHMREQQRGAERALTLLAEVSTAFGEAMRQLDDARRVGDGFRGAVRELEYATQRERRLQEELGKLTIAFDEAMKQLSAASVAAEGFRAAMGILEGMRARQADLAARVLMLEEELRRSQRSEAVGQRETGSEGMNSDGGPRG